MPEKTKKIAPVPFTIKSSIGAEGKLFEKSIKGRKSVIIGRASDCDVVITDAKASRHHCKLTRQPDAFVIEDLESKNGTFVEGVRIAAPVVLKANQTFKVGDTVFYMAS